jgi:hypothetical protein
MIAQSVYQQTGRPEFKSQQGQNFSLLYNIQTGSGAHPASYPIVSGTLTLGVKKPGREADHSPPSSAKAKNGGGIPPLPMSSWYNASLIKHKDNFTFTSYYT